MLPSLTFLPSSLQKSFIVSIWFMAWERAPSSSGERLGHKPWHMASAEDPLKAPLSYEKATRGTGG